MKLTDLNSAQPDGFGLPGREEKMPIPERHEVLGSPLLYTESSMSRLIVGMGCFWGAERLFWQRDGVVSTAVGYAGGATKNPTYEEVCSGLTGHAEVVNIVFDEQQVTLDDLLTLFWQEHDPTQGARQGNDIGTQYRSAIYCTDEMQLNQCLSSRDAYQIRLTEAGLQPITTEVALLDIFYFAEPYHQQYLAKNPGGYCGLAGTGVKCGI